MSKRHTAATIAAIVLSSVVLTGCTWVKLTPEGAGVRATTGDAVASCERIGRTKARTRAKAWVFPRNQDRVREELLSLARDDAAEMGGTDVAPLGEMADGRQEFGIYRCDGVAEPMAGSGEAGGVEGGTGDEPAP